MKPMLARMGILLLCVLCLGCTAQQWQTTKEVLAVTAVVGILAIGEGQRASYPPV